MDWSNFFATYTPYTPETLLSATIVDTSAITNPYNDIDLGTHLFTDEKLNTEKPKSIWDSIGWTSSNASSETTDSTNNTSEIVDDFTMENYRLNNQLSMSDTSQKAANAFSKTVAPIIESNIRELNSSKDLGLTELQILEATRRITFQNAIESSYGTSNAANKNNNLGGVKYTKWLERFGGSVGITADDGGNYTNYRNIKLFYKTLINELYGNRYRAALYANSDREFILILKLKGYFTADPNRYYSLVFNSKNNNAWLNYKGQ